MGRFLKDRYVNVFQHSLRSFFVPFLFLYPFSGRMLTPFVVQMDEMQALAEQRKAGMLLDNGKVVHLNVSLQPNIGRDSTDKDGGLGCEISTYTPAGTSIRTGAPSHPSSTAPGKPIPVLQYQAKLSS